MPCGESNNPSPKDFTSWPRSSNLKIDGSCEPAQEFAPQRSATQMLDPSLSMSTALVAPQTRPSGSLAQPSMVLKGFGAEFMGAMAACGVCALATEGSSRRPDVVNRMRVRLPILAGNS